MSKFCPNCGQQLDDGTAFCSNCGTAVPVDPYLAEQTPANDNQVDANYGYNNPNNGNPMNNGGGFNPFNQKSAGTAWSLGGEKKLVNKVAYGILAILLGGIGIHKFYAGKMAWGIVYILLCWK